MAGESIWRLPARLFLIGITGLVLLWMIASFWFPFSWDQGFFASVGDVILRGGMPYRDGWEIKGPLTHYGFALAQWLFGRHMWSIRVLDLPFLILGMLALGIIVSRITSPLRGFWAAILFPLWIGSLTWRNTIQPDTWATVFVIIAAVPLVERNPRLAGFILSGLAIGCASLVKPIYLGFVVLPLMAIVSQPKSRDRAASLRVAASTVGAALCPGLIALAWFAYRGALHDLVDVHFLYNLQVYSQKKPLRLSRDVKAILTFFFTRPVVWALPLLASGAYSLLKRRSSAFIVFSWLVMGLLVIAMQGKFYKYHWVLVFPPLLAMAAVGSQSALQVFRERNAFAMRIASAAMLLLAAVAILDMAILPASGVVLWAKLMSGRISIERYYAEHRAGGFVVDDDVKAAAYIQRHTTPTDPVVVYGNNADITFLAGRPSPTRFLYAMALTEGDQTPVQAAYRREYVQALRKNPPVYFVVGVQWGSTSKKEALRGFPELQRLLDTDYVLETSMGVLDLYRRKPQPGLSAGVYVLPPGRI